MAQRPDPETADDTAATPPPFPPYEEFFNALLESIDTVGLFIDDVRHELDPSVGERRFECTVRLAPTEPPSRYHAHLTFTWDALLTYVTVYGAGADCEIYHDDEDAEDCPHQHLPPQPFLELQCEFVLGDGGYELQEVSEITAWVETTQLLLAKAFTTEDRPSVHVGLAAIGPTVLVEKFTAEHSWLIDFERQPDLTGIARQIQSALKLVPTLADRLPI